MREAEDIWAERVRLLAPYQVNADLMRKARAGKDHRMPAGEIDGSHPWKSDDFRLAAQAGSGSGRSARGGTAGGSQVPPLISVG